MSGKTNTAPAVILVGRTGSGHKSVAEECARRGICEKIWTAMPRRAVTLKRKLGASEAAVIYIKASLDRTEESSLIRRRLGEKALPEHGFDGFEQNADYIFSFSRDEDLGKICEAIEFLVSRKL